MSACVPIGGRLPPHVPGNPESHEQLRDWEFAAMERLPPTLRATLIEMPETMPDAAMLLVWVLETYGWDAIPSALQRIKQASEQAYKMAVEQSYYAKH